MGIRFDHFPVPSLAVVGPPAGLVQWVIETQWRLIAVKVCDYCNEHETPDWDSRMCNKCFKAFGELADRISAQSGMPVTAQMLAGLRYRPNVRQFRYGKPWQHHLPPHERKRYGLHT